jgi:tRNA pseudouridine55 synthase
VSIRGFLNINKPAGLTSRDVVNRVQRIVRPAKTGHAGTLDPLATGVLIVAIGAATRLIEFVQQMTKEYQATFLLGRSSTTEDVEGEITLVENPPQPSRDDLVAAAARLTGEILQRPPAYSALKVAGRRAYQLARRGETPDLAPRPVTIEQFDVQRYEYPEFEARIRCSSGTYIRSLGRDLAESLGTAAVMSQLVRTAIGGFRLDDSHSLEDLSAETLSAWVQPVTSAVEHLARYDLSEFEAQALRHGRPIECRSTFVSPHIAAFDPRGELLGILAVRQPGFLAPDRMLPAVG